MSLYIVDIHGDIEGDYEIVRKYEEQEPFINKPCVSSSVCEHDKNKVLDKIRAEIIEEKDCAYADFERYKVEYLGQDWEDALDSLPQDDFRYGMERAIEILDKCRADREALANIYKPTLKADLCIMDEYAFMPQAESEGKE